MKDFLQSILPTKGIYCLTHKHENGYFVHKTLTNLDDFCKLASAWDANGKDVFFAVNSLKNERYFDKNKTNKQTGEKGVWVVRVHENMAYSKALFLDIDCRGKKEQEYKSKQEGLVALKKFCVDSGFPKPTIVDSGGGLHVYWALKQDVDIEVWGELSFRFKQLVEHLGFRADPSRTSDLSSVLRVPGTHNYKNPDDPQEVRVLSFGDANKADDIVGIIDKALSFFDVKLKTPKMKFAGADLFDNTLDEEVDGELIYANCKQMKRVLEIGGPVGYGTRSCAASIIKFMKVKDYSILWANDPCEELVKSQTDDMLNSSVTDNPSTCERFREFYADACEGCPKDGKGSSPIVLGYGAKELEPPKIILDETDEKDIDSNDTIETVSKDKITIELPSAPYPFKRTKRGIIMQTESGDDGIFTSVSVCEYDIYPYELVNDIGRHLTIKVKAHLPNDEVKDFAFEAGVLTDVKSFAKLFTNQGVFLVGNDKWGMLNTYMSSYIQEIQKKIKATVNYPQFGWQEDTKIFVMSTYSFNESGDKVPYGLSPTMKNAAKLYVKKGSLDKWVEVIDVYNRPGYENYAFGHLTGYGSLLFQFTQYAGAIVNMIGDSGSGKTTVLKTINSIYGHPVEPLLQISDKIAARMNRIGVLNSLPATFDEITNISPEELGDFCYAITNGRDKHRLNPDATEKDNNTHWKLMLASTSNSSLINKLGILKQDSSAEALRVFEYRIDCQDIFGLSEAVEMIDDKLSENYGHAVDVFVPWVMRNKDIVKQMLADTRKDLETRTQATVRERFWLTVASTTIVGGLIAKKLGLCNFNMDSITQWTVEQVIQMRGNINDNKRDARSVLVEYLNLNMGSTITVMGGTATSKQMYTTDEVRGKLFVRNEIDLGLVYLDRAAFKGWLTRTGGDYTSVKKSLLLSKILVNDNKHKVLTANSNTQATGQSICWVINMRHPEMAGVSLKPVTVDNPVENVLVGEAK